MDFVLFGISIFYFIKGYLKGFVTMAFSMLGSVFIIIITWKLSGLCAEIMQNGVVHDGIANFLSEKLNQMFVGEFNSMSEFESTISQSKYGLIFATLFKMLIKDISFDGTLTAGQIFAPSLANLTLKIVCFVTLFVVFMILLKILRLLLNKIIKFCGLNWGNKWLGGILGVLKGLIIFAIFYFVFSALANFLMNEKMINFLQNGVISNYLYENLIFRIINLF